MKQRDMIRILIKNGFVPIRSSKHLIYSNNIVTVAIPHQKQYSKGLTRRILQQANLKHEINF
jgi:predicted RNA binding protein YcfA (HicA-like mRNA interferase family)